MKNEWIPSKLKYKGKYAAITHKLTGEMAVNCKYGEVWEYSRFTSCVRVTSSKAAKKIQEYLYSTKPLSTNQGAEYVFKFSDVVLPAILKLLGYRNNKVSMAKRANKTT